VITAERLPSAAGDQPDRPGQPAPGRRRRASRRPGKVTVDHIAASFGLMLLTIATAVGMCRVFSDWHFLRSLVVMAVVVHAAALLLRILRVHAVLAMPFTALVVYEVVALLFYRDTMRFGLPARETMSLLRLDLRLVWNQFPSAVPPVPSTGSYLVIATLAIGAVALLADAFAFRAFGRAEAAVPSGVLFIFTAALGTDRNRVSCTALWLAVALLVVGLLRALHGGVDESWLGRRGRTLRSAAPAAMMCAALVALVASVAGPRLPGAGSDALLDTHQTQSDVTEVVSPLVDIRSRLVNRSNTEMFTVEASAGRYWRLSGLSEFDGTQWGLPDNQTLEDSGGVLNDPVDGSTVLQQRIKISRMGGNLLPAAFAPITVSGSGVLWLSDTDTLVVDEGFTEGDVFTVASTDPHPPADLLRTATSTAPSPEFLELPSDFPSDVRALAQRVVLGATTVYDQARALQDYFRNNFTYDLTVQKGHSDDAIVSFLRIQRGYCEQFSATFAAMARSLGIPSRVAVGFTEGELQPDGKYHVYGKHAHAWPEVWFDGYGWVAFEPTPGRGAPGGEGTTGVAAAQDTTPLPTGGGGEPVPATAPPVTLQAPPSPIEPGAGSVPTPTTAPTLAPAPASSPGGGITTGGWITLAILALGAWMLLMPYAVRRFTRRGGTPTEQVIDAWHGTIGALQLAGAPPPSGATPMEYAHAVEHRLPVDYRSLLELARFVTRAIYAPSGVGEPAALRAAVLQTQLERVARDITPWRTRLITRLDPRLVRLQLVGEGRERHAR